jgi:hypothetical protein
MKKINWVKGILDTAAILIVAGFILVGATRCNDAYSQEYLTCRNNAGEIIHIAPPNLCPYGYWQI